MWPSGHGMALVTFSCLLFLPLSAGVFIAGEWHRAAALGCSALPFFTSAELVGGGSALPPDPRLFLAGCLG